jgi:hypothetical protein
MPPIKELLCDHGGRSSRSTQSFPDSRALPCVTTKVINVAITEVIIEMKIFPREKKTTHERKIPHPKTNHQ